MPYDLPVHGEANWDTKLVTSMDFLKAAGEAAQADATQGIADAAAAQATADAAETPAGAQAKADQAETNAEATAATALATALPAGVGMEWYGPTAPDGWFLQDGSELPIATYTNLYNALTVNGTVFPFGANTNGSGGAGTTHFRLPNRKGRVGVMLDSGQGEFDAMGETGGAKTHTLTEAEMPSHAHGAADGTANIVQGGGGTPAGVSTGGTGYATNWTGNTGGGGAHNNLQPYMVVNYIIKA